MGYVAVRGGGKAIEESLKLLECERVSASASWGTDEIEGTFPELVDQVMGEASLYAPRLAALALKQAQGSPDEAVFLLRAFRSTLERPYVSRPVDTAQMRVARRVSAAFKDVPGGQVLGATRDYSHRLLAFDLETEGAEELAEKRAELTAHFDEAAQASEAAGREGVSAVMPRVLDYLRAQGLLAQVEADDAEPVDATMVPLSFPAPRSVRLQTLARGMTQAVEALGYAAIRGFGPAHPTVGELRQGRVAVAVDHPLEAGGPEDAYYLGSIPVTEVESVFEDEGASGASEGAGAGTGAGSGGGSTGGARAAGGSVEGVAAAAGSAAGCSASGGASLALTVGYGLVFGRAETKAIAMSVLDHCLEHGDARYPTEDEEFVLYHVDGVEATGFISHLKLPHYVTFQSKLSSVRETRGAEPEEASHAAAL
ncbi:carbon-phosphorus lyase [Rubneribacter badeniensis]|uniref:Carbon-phosphorus lyase n=1 Tax=Rubneribacter badeniensis TaxID=2070688 RepID=A0A2K2U4X1_9ACTN|nr:carbon-phosphorus lyase complex subunit PhnI [Rubneribacter badeniensis]OUO91972.1 carbon-phosphorus lyase [Gordonibacter sp. An232A]PNV65240.1 carbon-phosphorus lyase [Rubneribacter badeniensis]